MPFTEKGTSAAKVATERSSKYFAKSVDLLQTDYTIDAKSVLGLLSDRKLPRYGSLPRRPRQLEGREMSHDVLEDSDYPRASPNVSNLTSSKALVPKLRTPSLKLLPWPKRKSGAPVKNQIDFLSKKWMRREKILHMYIRLAKKVMSFYCYVNESFFFVWRKCLSFTYEEWHDFFCQPIDYPEFFSLLSSY